MFKKFCLLFALSVSASSNMMAYLPFLTSESLNSKSQGLITAGGVLPAIAGVGGSGASGAI